ncbi:hypothetical protein D3C86_1442450 [compost metagenome]
MRAAQEGAGVAEFVRHSEAPGWVGGAAAREHFVFVQAVILRPLARRFQQPVGFEGARQKVVEGDVVRHVLAGQAGHETGQAGACAVGQAKDVDRRLHGGRGDVHDAAEAARHHAVERGADHLDGREHVGVERGDPGIAVPVPEVAGLGAARVVHEDVGRRVRGQRGFTPGRRGDVGRHGMHRHATRAANVCRRLFEGFAAPCHQRQAHTFTSQRHGAGASEAAARCADQRVPALEPELHRPAPRTAFRPLAGWCVLFRNRHSFLAARMAMVGMKGTPDRRFVAAIIPTRTCAVA